MLPRWLVIALAILISVAWAANLVVGLLYPGRSDPYLNGIFALVVGAAFTISGVGSAAKAVRRKIARAVEPPPEDSDDRGGQS